MPQDPPSQQRWRPYGLLLLLPLALVGLDSYGGLFTHPVPSRQPLGLWPRRLSAGIPHSLSLQLSPHAETPDTLSLTPAGGQPQQLRPRIDGSDWSAALPGLSPGLYKLQLRRQNQSIGPEMPLQVKPEPFWQLRSDRGLYQPGDWLIASLRQPIGGAALSLAVYGSRHELLWQQTLPTAHSPASSLQQQRIRLPENLLPGEGLLLLRQGAQLLEARTFGIGGPAAGDAGLMLAAGREQLLLGLDQSLELYMTDAKGLPVEQGWVRLLGRTVAIRAGAGKLELKASECAPNIDFAAGDSRGNLLQGSLRFALNSAGWQPDLDAQDRPRVQTTQSRSLNWIAGQGSHILQSGLTRIEPPAGRIPLPEPPDNRPLWLSLCEPGGSCQQLQWLPAPARATWALQPPQPDALEPVRVTPGPEGKGLIESFRSLNQGLSRVNPTAGAVGFYDLGQPEPAPDHPLFLTLWALAALALPLLPLMWLRRFLSLQQRPFPNPERRKRSQQGQLWGMGFSAAGLLGLLLCWAGQSTLAAGGGFGAGLIVSALLGWWLRPLLAKAHPLAPWIPLLQVLLLGLSFWFCLTYQPILLGAFFLTAIGLGLLWGQIWQRLIPLSQLQNPRILTLASLSVALFAHLLLLPHLPQPLPAWLSTQTAGIVKIPAFVPQTRLLDYQLWPAGSTQILPAARRAGAQVLHWRIWPEAGSPQDLQQALDVKPALLAELQAPSLASVGDRLQIPLRLINETSQTQQATWRLRGPGLAGEAQSLSLSPRSEQTLRQELRFDSAGWQTLELEHQYRGRWTAQSQRIFVQAQPRAHSDPRLILRIDLPQASGLVPGEEIPLLVHFHQASGRHAPVGLQLGLPAGFAPIVDTLGTSARRSWLRDFELRQGQLNIQTLPLASGQEVSFHFRLQAIAPGKVRLPVTRMFLLDQPQVETVTSSEQWIETIPSR